MSFEWCGCDKPDPNDKSLPICEDCGYPIEDDLAQQEADLIEKLHRQ